jgi:hypothetical protein
VSGVRTRGHCDAVPCRYFAREEADLSSETGVVRTLLAAVTIMLVLCPVGGPAFAQAPMPLAQTGPITLTSPRADVRLDGEGPLAARLKTVAPTQRLFLRLEGLKSEQTPGVSYNVFLNLPDGRPPQGTRDPHYLGTFSFFDTEGRERAVEIDVTERLKRLAADGKLGAHARLTLAAAGEPSAGARPRIGRVLIVARS